MIAGAVVLAAMAVPATWALADPAPVETKMSPTQAEFDKALHKKTGDVAIVQAGALLHLGTKYYFLDAVEAKRVLTEVWGNPSGEVSDVLGMVMPADKTVFDNSWGAVITFKDSGYVTDDDADSADYNKILADMQSGEQENNAERVKAGYKAMHLVGWAQPPSYDKATHSLVWARELRLDGDPVSGLNYDVRVLGRKGVLSMNMLWDMPHLPDVRTAAGDLGKTATFTTGDTYAEYNSSTDKAAGYGLAGLVAGGVAIAAAKKLGFLGLILVFGKKFLVVFAIAGAAIAGFFKKLFGRGRGGGDDDQPNAGIT